MPGAGDKEDGEFVMNGTAAERDAEKAFRDETVGRLYNIHGLKATELYT